uniref:hypothetical protein n=1 Tax=Streptococcus suis TaxID=1307 RepID=UPI0005CD3132
KLTKAMVKLPKARIVCTTSKAETSPDVLFYRYEIPSMPLPFKLAFSSFRVIIEIEKGSCANNYPT